MSDFIIVYIAALAFTGLVCFVAGVWFTRITVKGLTNEYLDKSTELWLAASMVCLGANKYENGDTQNPTIRQVLIYETDLLDLKAANKGMEDAMCKYEEAS